jgi:hypothetical protein
MYVNCATITFSLSNCSHYATVTFSLLPCSIIGLLNYCFGNWYRYSSLFSFQIIILYYISGYFQFSIVSLQSFYSLFIIIIIIVDRIANRRTGGKYTRDFVPFLFISLCRAIYAQKLVVITLVN